MRSLEFSFMHSICSNLAHLDETQYPCLICKVSGEGFAFANVFVAGLACRSGCISPFQICSGI